MDEQKKATIEDAIRQTVGLLSGIMVPAPLLDSIGVPVFNSINNLKRCLEWIDDEKKRAKSPQEEPEITVEAVEVEPDV